MLTLPNHSYFSSFHEFLPILEPTWTPNQYYSRSPFLFWAITGVSCRGYIADPTLLGIFAPKITTLSLMSLRTGKNRPVFYYNIQALLLVLTWPFPTPSLGKDTTFPLSGALLHMAMQIGLHIPSSSQDFSRTKLHLTDADLAKRAELWAHCMIVYQRMCNVIGQIPLALLDSSLEPEKDRMLQKRLPQSLRFQLKLHEIIAKCCGSLLENGLMLLNKDKERSLDILIRIFESQLKELEIDAVNERDKIYYQIARLTTQSFYFYKTLSSADSTHLTRLYTTASQVIDMIDRLNINDVSVASAPYYMTYSAVLSSSVLIRILKSPFAQYLDLETARASFFLGVNLCKRLSLENNDLPAKFTTILTQLYSSEKSFKRPDGTHFTELRIRSRLTLSPVLDTLWWWRDEYGDQRGVYAFAKPEGTQEGNGKPASTRRHSVTRDSNPSTDQPIPVAADGQLEANAATNLVPTGPFFAMEAGRQFDDPIMSDFGFGVPSFADDLFYPFAIPSGNTPWPTNTDGSVYPQLT